jgi:ankyrin repeat protein
LPAIAGSYEDFFAALDADRPELVQPLLARGFDPNAHDEKGQLALYRALRAGSLKVAAQLIAHPQAQVDARNAAGETPLMMAALRGQVEIARALLERGAQAHFAGWSPLHYAASGPEWRVLELLVSKGAMVDARSPNGSTPLMMASRYGSEAAVQLLLDKGANPALKNDLGLSAADFARQVGRDKLADRLSAAAR